MSARSKYKRKDANHDEIVEALERIGATVQSLSGVGDGCPDLLVGFRGRTDLLEVKSSLGKENEEQLQWARRWNGSRVAIVHNIGEAIDAVLRR